MPICLFVYLSVFCFGLEFLKFALCFLLYVSCSMFPTNVLLLSGIALRSIWVAECVCSGVWKSFCGWRDQCFSHSLIAVYEDLAYFYSLLKEHFGAKLDIHGFMTIICTLLVLIFSLYALILNYFKESLFSSRFQICF